MYAKDYRQRKRNGGTAQAAKVGEDASRELKSIDETVSKLAEEKKKMISLMEVINQGE